MEWLYFILAAVGLVATGVKWLRWLSFAQQKEYRIDRLSSWLNTSDARHELWRLPKLRDLTRTGLKRPKMTARLATVAMTSGGMLGGLLVAGWYVGALWGSSVFLGIVIALFAVTPGLVLMGTWPSALLSEVITRYRLLRASRLVATHQPLIIGIGGCYGKTTTKLLVHQILQAHQPTFTTPYSYNTRSSVAASILRTYQGEKTMLIEYGTYRRGEISELTRYFPPQMAVETGFTEQHLSLFGSIENILAAEGELVAALPTGAPVFCHAADAGALRIAEVGIKQSGAKIIPYTGAKAVVEITQTEMDDVGHVSFKWQGHHIATKLVGRHYEANIRAAIAVAEHLGIPAAQIAASLSDFKPNERFVRTGALGASLVIDDGFAVNPMGFQAAIELLSELKAKRQPTKTVVAFAGIVDLGSMSTRIHTQLAKALHDLEVEVWYLGATGRDEFEAVFGKALVKGTDAAQVALRELLSSSTTFLLLQEGRLPLWLTQGLDTHAKK